MVTQERRSFVVVGLGAFGSTVATALAANGDDVLGIDIDEKRVRQYAEKLAHAVIADARDEDALREAGAGNHDVAVVAIGEDLEANILCTMNVKLLGVDTIWVKALSKTHHRILSRIGVDRVIFPERDMGLHVAETLHAPFVADFVSLGNGFHVTNFILPETRKLKTVGALRAQARPGIKVLGLMRGSDFVSCIDDGVALNDGDRLLILGRRDGLRALADSL
jgi:trk system potassium uptake protein